MGLLDRWQSTRGGAVAGASVGEQAPPSGGLLDRWQSTRPAAPRPADPFPVAQAPVARPIGVPPRPSTRPSPGSGAYWANLPQAPAKAPAQNPHLLQLMQQELAKPKGQLYREEYSREKAAPWATHFSSQHSLLGNLAAPFLYAGKAIGEPFMATARLARGIPGADALAHGAGMLNKWLASKPAPRDPYGNIQITHDPGDYAVPEAKPIDPNAGYHPADLAGMAPPGVAGKFAPGGSAVFGERAVQQMQELSGRRNQAREQAQSAAWSDPRNSQTAINQALSGIPGIGALLDPQTKSIGEVLGEESGNPYMGMALDALAGISPLALGKMPTTAAKAVAGRFSMPSGRLGQIAGLDVNPGPALAKLADSTGVTGLAERAGRTLAEKAAGLVERAGTELAQSGILDRWLANSGRAERGLDATTQLPAIPGEGPIAGTAQAPPLSRLGQRAGREAGGTPPTLEPPPMAARDGAQAPPPPARDIPGGVVPPEAPARPVTIDDIKTQLGEAKKEFNALNSSSIDGALTDADKARMIFLRTALPGLQKQLKQLTKAAAQSDVQYSGALTQQANVLRLVQSATPEQLSRFVARADELALSMGGRKSRTAARKQALEEMLLQQAEDVQYAGNPQFNQGPQPGPRGQAPAPQPGPASPPPTTPAGVATASRPAPQLNLSGEVKSQPHIARDIRDTMGMISRGETQAPGILSRIRNAITQPGGPRISYGEGNLPQGAGGAHHGSRELIQIRRPADGDTTFHELGHFIAKQGRVIDTAPQRAFAELEALGDPANSLVPSSKTGTRSSWSQGMGVDYKRGEGWAEFLRVWMTHPDEAERLAPEMSRHFEGWLDSQGEVGTRMRQHQADVQARANADFARRMDAQVMAQKTHDQLQAHSSKDGLITRFFDRFHPLRKLRDAAEGHAMAPTRDFYRKATMLASTVKNETSREVERLADIFREIREAPNPRQAEDELRRYLYARRAEELHGRGMRSGFESSDVAQALRDYDTPTNRKVAQELYKFQDEQLEFLREKGMLSQEALDKIRAENQSYIPMQRHFELGAGEMSNQKGGIAGASLKASNPIKAIRGSEREILDPLVSVIANTYKVRMSAHKNDVLLDMLRFFESNSTKAGHHLEEVHPPQTFTSASVSEVLKEPKLRSALEDLGVDVANVTPVELETLIEMLPEGTIVRPNQAMLDAEHIIPVRDGGETRYLKLSPEMHRSVTGIGSEFTTDPMSWLNTRAGGVLRATATSLNWKFALRNALRDSGILPLVSRVGGLTNLPFFPFADGLITNLRAAAGNPKAKEIAKRWRESGGKQEFASQYADRTGAEKVLHDGVLPSRESAPVRTVKTLGKAAKSVLGVVSEASEDATRLGHYKAAEAYAQRNFPAWTPEDVHLFAAFEARDALDFSRRGSSPAVRWARANIPFLGAGMEGTRRQIEAAIENPQRYFGMGIATMSLPTVLNQTGIPGVAEGQWNNPDYWQLDQRKRDNDTIIRNPLWDGKDSYQEFLKYPREKGPAALFAQVPEWLATAARGDSTPAGQRAQQIAGTVISNFTPSGINPLEPRTTWNLLGEGVGLGAEMMANYDSYRDKPIVPDFIQRQHPDKSQQYDDRTSVLARFLGEKMGVSPMMIDHAIYGTTAGLGQSAINYVVDPILSQATQLTDKPIKEAPSRQVTSPMQALLDLSGMGVYPGQPASVRAFDEAMLKRKQAEDRAMAHPRNKREAREGLKTIATEDRSKRLKALDKKVNRLQRQLRLPEQTPEMRRQLELELREVLKDFRPFKEVAP